MTKLSSKLSLGPVDPLGLISPERMEELRVEARAKALAKLRKAAEDKFLAKAQQEEEQALDPKPQYEMRDVVIDVAEHTDAIIIDGQHFFYGHRYTVAQPVYSQLLEIMARGWRHEAEISSPSTRLLSRNRNDVLHGGGGNQGVTF